VAISLHLSPSKQVVWEYPPAVLAIPQIGRGFMTKSTGTRRLAQAACLIAVFACGSNVVFSQDAERKVVKKVEPEYPAVLRDKGIGGTVKLRVTIKPDGSVKDIQTLGGNAVLVDAATRAVRQWHYVPAEKETTMDVSIHFGQR
jgi:TonB family protein